MENKNIDLSALRISRNQEQQDGPPQKTGTYIGIAVSILILGIAGFFLYQSLFTPAIEVTLTTVSWTSPSQSNAVLTAFLVESVAISLLGGFLPAARAARLKIVDALRSA